MASIQEIVARRSPVASLPQASPNPNTGLGITSEAGSGGFRQLGQVRGIPLNTATGFGEAGMIDAESVGAIGQTIGQIATAVDELNEASEKARLISAGKLADKKIKEWNSISGEAQRKEFRAKHVGPALAKISSERRNLTAIANNSRNARVSEMGILGNAHKLNAAKANGYMELSKLQIELDAAKGLDKEEMIDRYRSLSTSLITSGLLEPKEAYLLGNNTQAILKISTQAGLTEEFKRQIETVPDDKIVEVLNTLAREGKGFVFPEDSAIRPLEVALDKSPAFRSKLLEDERTRRLKRLQDYVKEAVAKESLAFITEQDALEKAKSSVRTKMNDYEGGDVAGFTDDLLKEYDGYSNTFKKKLRAEADTALRIGVTLRSMKSKSLADAAILELLAPDENGGPDIFQAYTNAQDPNKFIDDYLSSPASENFRDLLKNYGYNPEVVGRAYFRKMALTPEARKSAFDFKTPRDTIFQNFIKDAEDIVTKNVSLASMDVIDPQAIPRIIRQITAKAIQIREANPKMDDYKKALNDYEKTFKANPRIVLQAPSKAAGIPRAIIGEPADLENIDKIFETLSLEKQVIVDTKVKRIINSEMLRNPKLTEKVALGKATKAADLFNPLGKAILKNPNVSKEEKAKLMEIVTISAQKIHQVEVEKVEALRGQPQEISEVLPDGVRTPEWNNDTQSMENMKAQQFVNTHTQAEDFPVGKGDMEGFAKVKPVEDQETMLMGFARHLGKLVTGDASFELPDMIDKGLGSRDSRTYRPSAAAKVMKFDGEKRQWNEDTQSWEPEEISDAKAMLFDGEKRQWNNDTQSWEPVKEATTPAAIPDDAGTTSMRSRLIPDVNLEEFGGADAVSEAEFNETIGGEELNAIAQQEASDKQKVDTIHNIGMKAEAGEVTGNVFTVGDTVETDENGDPLGKVIGFGHNLLPLELANKEIKIGGVFVDITNGLSKEKAKALYYQDMAVRYAKLEKNLPDVDAPDVWSNLSETQKVALTSAMYNNRFLLTLTGGAKSKARKFLEQGEYEKAASQTTDSQNIVRDSTRLKELVFKYRVPSRRKWISKSSLSDIEKLKMYRFLKERLKNKEIDPDVQPTLYRIITEGMAIENVDSKKQVAIKAGHKSFKKKKDKK